MKQGQIKFIESILKSKKVKIQGVKIDLTDEQLQKLQQLVEPKYKNPFERVNQWEYYYSIDVFDRKFEVVEYIQRHSGGDNSGFINDNYYNDKEFAEQVALDLNLQQRLRKFSYENGWRDELWEDTNTIKYSVFFDWLFKNWCFGTTLVNRNLFDVYFKDAEVARRAIEEVVKPFCKENPNYRFQEE